MPKVTLYEGDNRVSLAAMADNSVDSVVTDPPYGLISIQKRFGKEGSAPARTESNDGSFNRLSKGFMGKTWDGTGIEQDPVFWAEVLRVMKPGAYLVAFSSSRTFHRMTCAIEDAGFIIHPLIGWLNGQGFPKAHAADKAIDKMLVGPTEAQSGAYVPATDEAAEWQGWAYGGQVRKPALEPICVAQKPFSEKSGAANILKWGVGAVNIDGCRVPLPADDALWAGIRHVGRKLDTSENEGSWGFKAVDRQAGLGRHPANLIHDGSPEVVALFPHTKSGKPGVMRKGTNDGACFGAESRAPGTLMTGFGYEGSAARFFESYPFDAQPAFYHPKAGKDDRAGSRHPTVKPIALMAALVRHVTPPGGVVLDPFAGSGTTGEACQREGVDCILMEADPEHINFLNSRFSIRDEDDLLPDLFKTDDDDLLI